MELTPIQKLDAVLNYINTAQNPPCYTFKQVMEKFKDFGTKNVVAIILQIKNDGNLYQEFDAQRDVFVYFPTFSGMLLQQNNGYEAKFLNQDLARNHAEQVERVMMANNMSMRRWTKGAAIFAGLYLIWCIISFGIDHHWWLCCLSGWKCCNCH